jgi:hypothetical protein
MDARPCPGDFRRDHGRGGCRPAEAALGAALLVILAMLVRSMIVLPLVLAGLVVAALLAGWSSLVSRPRPAVGDGP